MAAMAPRSMSTRVYNVIAVVIFSAALYIYVAGDSRDRGFSSALSALPRARWFSTDSIRRPARDGSAAKPGSGAMLAGRGSDDSDTTTTTTSSSSDTSSSAGSNAGRRSNDGGAAGPAALPSGWHAPHAVLPPMTYCDDVACTGVVQVVSLSLYGSNPRYTVGAIHNSELAREAFPEWVVWVYIPETTDPATAVPEEVQATLVANGALIHKVDAATVAQVGFGMNQRFLIAGESGVARFIVRDSDSRLSLRERWAVNDWIASGLPFSTLRDHPSHSNFFISGGLWGAVNGSFPHIQQAMASHAGKDGYLADMIFLNDVVRPAMVEKGVYQNDAFSCDRYGAGATGFPKPRCGGEHVGGVYDPQDNIREGDVGLLPPQGHSDACRPHAYPADGRRLVALVHATACDGLATCHSAAVAAGVEATGQVVAVIDEAAQPAAIADAVVSVTFFEAKEVFVDGYVATCAGGAPVAPVLFDYERYLHYATPADGGWCAPPAAADVKQLHERMAFPHTTYTGLLPGGLQFNRFLFVNQALYLGAPHAAALLGLALALQHGTAAPPYSRMLVPDTPATDALMTLATATLAEAFPDTWAVAEGSTWRALRSVRVHMEPQTLAWGFRVQLAAVSGVAAADAYAAGTLPPTSSPAFGAVAATALAAASIMEGVWNSLVAGRSLPDDTCRVAPLALAASHYAAFKQLPAVGAGAVAVDAAPAVLAAAAMSSHVVLVSATTPSLYLALARPGTLVAFLGGAGAPAADKYLASPPGAFATSLCTTARLTCTYYASASSAGARITTVPAHIHAPLLPPACAL